MRSQILELPPSPHPVAHAASPRGQDPIRSLVETCDYRHGSCRRGNFTDRFAVTLPTRVLDVGEGNCGGLAKLYVTKGEKGRYIVLVIAGAATWP